MNGNDALKLAFAGTPVAHKSFTDPTRFIVCAEQDGGLELIDTASDFPAQWLYLVAHYGNEGWHRHKPTAYITQTSDEEPFVSQEYLSDLLEEVIERLESSNILLEKLLAIVEEE